MPRLNQDQRNQAVGMLNAGQTVSAVSRAFGCTRRTITLLIRRFRQTGSVQDRVRTGRPRKTTARDDRYIALTHLRQRHIPATITARRYGVNAQTIRNRLRARHRPIRAYRPYFGQILTPAHRNARVNWCRRYLRYNRNDWNNVLFTDESRFNLSHSDGRARVYRRKGERYTDACVLQRNRFGGGSVMIWGGIMGGRKTRLVVVNGNLNAQGYINQILAPEAIPFIQRHGARVTLQQDNARPHTARVTQRYLRQNNVNVLPWPANSPDLNPIEHIWDVLGRRVHRRHLLNVQDLRNALVAEWQNVAPGVIRRYVNSMRARIRAVLANRGGHTRY